MKKLKRPLVMRRSKSRSCLLKAHTRTRLLQGLSLVQFFKFNITVNEQTILFKEYGVAIHEFGSGHFFGIDPDQTYACGSSFNKPLSFLVPIGDGSLFPKGEPTMSLLTYDIKKPK